MGVAARGYERRDQQRCAQLPKSSRLHFKVTNGLSNREPSVVNTFFATPPPGLGRAD
jgi:hypothetical protein